MVFLFVTVTISNRETSLRFVPVLYEQLMCVHSLNRVGLQCKLAERLVNVSMALFIRLCSLQRQINLTRGYGFPLSLNGQFDKCLQISRANYIVP